ncbi:MAG: hypothetical protein IKE52_05510 [Mogibacterium sp.]|nr:hypothetical protein [Mogibacterium sp.]
MKDRINNKNSNKNKEVFNLKIYRTDIAYAGVVSFIFITCIELFYRMIVKYNRGYPSDMRYYAGEAATKTEMDPRLLDMISRALHSINGSTLEFNLFLAALIPAIIIMNYFVIRFLTANNAIKEQPPRYALQAASILALFTGPVFIPVLHEYYYIHSVAAFAWHNPTQHAMTLFSLAGTLAFLKMIDIYRKEQTVSVRYWIATMILMLLSAASKPSFVIELVPSVMILFGIFLFDTGKGNVGQRFIQLFKMGASIIPAGLYIIWLSTVDFGNTNGMEGSIDVVFGLSKSFTQENLFNIFIFGMPFSILVLAANYKRLKESKYFLSIMVFVMGVAQWVFLEESGYRARHGNFDWGRMYGTYFLALVSLSLLIENIYRPDSIFPNNKRARRIYLIIAIVILALSVLSQLNYFGYVLSGRKYMR